MHAPAVAEGHAVGDTLIICGICLRSNTLTHPRPVDHLVGWAPQNLQHHLAFDQGITAPYDGPRDELHYKDHGREC